MADATLPKRVFSRSKSLGATPRAVGLEGSCSEGGPESPQALSPQALRVGGALDRALWHRLGGHVVLVTSRHEQPETLQTDVLAHRSAPVAYIEACMSASVRASERRAPGSFREMPRSSATDRRV